MKVLLALSVVGWLFYVLQTQRMSCLLQTLTETKSVHLLHVTAFCDLSEPRPYMWLRCTHLHVNCAHSIKISISLALSNPAR